MDLYQNLRMLDIPGFRQFARFQPGSLQKTSHSSVKYQYFIVPIFPYTHVSFLSVFGFLLIYLSGTGSFCLNRPHSPLSHSPPLRYSDDRRHRLGRHHQKTFRQCNPHRLFRFQYPAEIRLARKRQISITRRKAGTQIESFFCCLRF